MRYFLVTGPMRQKDGSEAVETQLLRVSEAEGAPTPEEMGIDLETAIEVPRPALAFERWDVSAGAWAFDLAGLEAGLLVRIDEEAGAFRRRFITDVSGQEMTYVRKEKEARAYLAASAEGGEPHPADFPMLAAEATATGVDIAILAAEVAVASDAWVKIGSASEGARIGAKKAVRDAATAEAKRAAAAIDWEAVLAQAFGGG